jgi:hypothetical protein
VRTSITRIDADRRVGLKNSRDCDARILERKNGGNSAAGGARTYKFRLPHSLDVGAAGQSGKQTLA